MTFSAKGRSRPVVACALLLVGGGLVSACASSDSTVSPPGSGGSQSASSGGSGNQPGATGGTSAASGGRPGNGTGGAGTGGAATGGAATGGAATGGAATGGSSTGGTATGGSATGGSATGGSSAGGSGSGGLSTGGSSAGGSGHGGVAAGGAGALGTGGAAGSNAGGRAAPSADPTTFGLNGPSKCGSGSFAICEDFEATAVGAVPTGWTKEGAWMVAVSTGDMARGSHALQIAVGTDNNGRGFLNKTAAQLGPLATKHYGRIFYKLQNPPTKFVHWDFFHGPGPYGANNTNDVRWGFTGLPGPATYLFNVQTSSGEFGINSPTTLQLVPNTWTCVEWLLDSTVAGGGEARFWVNGTEVTNMHRTGTQAQIPVFSRYGIGWELFNSTNAASTALIDEVVFDPGRIGCNN